MGLIIAPDSAYGRELWKWDHPQGTSIGEGVHRVEGMRPRGFQAFPEMVYLVTQKNPWAYESAIAHDEQELRNLQSRGFVSGGLQDACDAYDDAQQALATAAAERNYRDRSMSDKAKAEIAAAESASATHLGEIPETPIRRGPGRPRKDSTQ